jgi:osmoprotectant transport system permease protein
VTEITLRDSMTPSEPDSAHSGATEEVPPARQSVISKVFLALGIAATLWYLFFASTAANNDVLGGLGQLLSGIWNLPRLLADTSAYANWWNFISEREGFTKIFANTVDHLQLVAMSMVWATAISVLLGVAIHRLTKLRGPILGTASIFLTIPSLALFAVFISLPGVGIGDRGPIIALTMYSILPILRNTVIGLEDVDTAIIESARGMGLSKTQCLIRVELPLAWPIILTGIRVAALLNIGIAAIAPLVGGSGLGGYIRDGLQRFPDLTSVERMWTGVVFTVLLALLIDAAFALLRRLTISKGLRS